MTLTEIVQILSGFVGSIGFAILFNIRGKRLVVTGIGGFASWFIFVILSWYIPSEAIIYFIVACGISIYAEIMARVVKAPTTTFIISSLIPLVPGSSLYYTMANAFEGNLTVFLQRGVYTLELAAALALGIIVSTAVAKIFYGTLNKRKKA